MSDQDTSELLFDESRRLTGSNLYFDGPGVALETAPDLVIDDAMLQRWRDNVAAARQALRWPDAAIVIRRHRSGASLAFAAPMDQLYAATEVNEWALSNAIAFPFSPREKVPEGRMRERTPASSATSKQKVPEEPAPETLLIGGRMRERTSTSSATPKQKLPSDEESRTFIRNLRHNATDPEQLIWSYVRNRRLHGLKFRRQHALGPYVLDFYCHELKLAIELDGGQHNESEQAAHDARRDAFMRERGVRTLRYWNDDVMARTEDVLVDVWRVVDGLMSGGAGDLARGEVAGESVPSSALRAPSPEGGRERQLHAPGFAAVWDAESALHTLGLLAVAETNPALLTLRDAAAKHGLPFLSDDDEVSIGTGCGSCTWSIDALPTSADIDWLALHAIPSALVTGSNGKTTTVRLLAAMARSNGWTTGYSSTDGLFVDAQRIDSGDYSGPMGARTVLRQTGVEAAVLETARGGLLRRGLAVDNACVAVVTNVSPDHFGEYGIHDLEALAEVKLTVARGLVKDGLLILNADDTLLLRRGAAMSRRIGWFALNDEHPQLRAHRDAGGATCGVRDGHLQLHFNDVSHDLGAIADMPITLSGAARYNIANAAAASLAATAMGIAIERIAQTLSSFGTRPGDNPGRLQRWQFGDTKVYLDYAHNPDGLDGLLQVATTDRDGGRLALILGQAGNREDADIRALAATAARFRPDRVWLKDMGEDYMRGRASGEVAEILGDELTKQGVPASAQSVCLDEGDAVREVLGWARPGDVLVLPIHQADSRDEIVALLDALDHAHWRPGQAVPAMPASQSDVSG